MLFLEKARVAGKSGAGHGVRMLPPSTGLGPRHRSHNSPSLAHVSFLCGLEAHQPRDGQAPWAAGRQPAQGAPAQPWEPRGEATGCPGRGGGPFSPRAIWLFIASSLGHATPSIDLVKH